MSPISQSFVEQLYSRFLGRVPDAGGLRFWRDILDSGAANAAQVTLHFLESREFADAVAPVARLYYTSFGRIPDAEGLQFWISRVQEGTPLEAIAHAFRNSSEYAAQDKPGTIDANIDDAIKVIALYHGTLGIAPTDTEIAETLRSGDPVAQLTALYGDARYQGAAVPGLIVRGVTTPYGNVFIDGNGNGLLDRGEIDASADALGNYSFEGQATFEGQLLALPQTGGSKGGGAGTGDTQAPVLTSSNPTSGQSGVSLTTLVFNFDEAIFKGSGNITLTNGTTQTILSNGVLTTRIVGATDTRIIPVGDAAVSISGSTMTITIPSGLKASTTYSMLVAKGAIEDSSGNDFVGMTTTAAMRFTTGNTPPSATSVTYSQGGFYNAGDTIDFLVHFDRNVTVDNGATPSLVFETGAVDSSAVYISGSGSNVLLFRYTVQAGDNGNYLHLKVVDSKVGQGLVGQVHDGSGTFLDQAHIMFSSLSYAGSGYGNTNITVDTEIPLAPYSLSLESYDDTGDSQTDGLTQSRAPYFKGVAEPYATVKLFKGTTQIGSGTANASGNYQITNVSDMGIGTHTVTATQVDRAGNESTATASLTIQINNNSAARPDPLTLATSSDTGTPGDGITTHTIVTIQGTGGLPNRVVWLYDGGIKIGETSADSGGNFSAQLAFTNGAHSLTAVNQDVYGNQSLPSIAFTLTVNSTGPSAPALAYADNSGDTQDNVTSDTTPAITGIAQPGSSIQLMKVNTTGPDTLLGTTTVPAHGVWTITGLTFTEGTHNLNVVETLNSVERSTTGTIKIDTTAPSAPAQPDLDPAYDLGTSPTDNATTLSHVRLFGADGSVEAGATVELFEDEVCLGTVTADEDGSWEMWVTLAPGATPHLITAVATDSAGNKSADSPAISILVSEPPASISAAPTLVAAYDSGISSTDGYTIHESVKFSGSGATGAASVIILNWGEEIGTAAVDGSGNWESALLPLGEGEHRITVIAVDANGIESDDESEALEVNVTPDAPYIWIDGVSDDNGPYQYDFTTNDTTPTIQGFADHGAIIHVLVDGVEVGTTTASLEDGEWTYALGTKTEGSYAISAFAVSLAGLTGATANASAPLVIDTQAPTGSLTAPSLSSSDDTGISSGDRLTKDATPMLEGTGGPANMYVRLYNSEGTQVGSGYVTSNGDYVALIDEETPLVHGANTIYARFEDLAGNLSAPTNSVVIDVDLQAPTTQASAASLDSGSDTGTVGDSFTRLTNPTFTGTASPGQRVKVSVDGVGYAIAVANGSGIWTTNQLTFWEEDEYDIIVTHLDDADNEGPPSAPLTLTIGPPLQAYINELVDDNGVYNYDLVTSDNTPRISGDGTPGATLHLKINSVDEATTVVVDENGEWTYTLPTQVDGDYSLNVYTTDTHGHTSSTSSTMTIKIDTTAPTTITTAPNLDSADDKGHSNSDDITKQNVVSVYGSGAEVGATVRIYNGATEIATSTVMNGGSWAVSLPSLPAGVHSLTAKFSDAAGNISGATNALSLTIDNTAPTGTATVASLEAASDSGALGDGITRISSPVLTGSATSGQRVNVYVNGVFEDSALAGVGNTWSLAATSISTHGSYTITVRLVDDAGNEGPVSPSFTFLLDKDSPTADLPALLEANGTPDTNDTVADATPSFSGSGLEIGDTVALYVNGSLQDSTTISLGGTWTLTSGSISDSSEELEEQAYIVVTDKAGNSSTSSTLYFTVDTTNPVLDEHNAGEGNDAISSDEDLVLTFDEDVFTTGSFVFTGASGFSLSDADVTVSGNTITLNTSGLLTAGGSYTLTLPAITDKAGNAYAGSTLAFDVAETEVVAPDTTAPQMSTSSVGLYVTLSFNENIQFNSSGNVYLYDANGSVVFTINSTMTSEYEINGGMISFTDLANNLGGYTGPFKLVLDNAIADLVGNVNTTDAINIATGVTYTIPS